MVDKLNIICFPYAGGNANIYNDWECNNVIGIEYNGHGSLFGKQFYKSIQEAADEIGKNIIEKGIKEYVLFGHSLGAIIAIETAHMLSMKDVEQPKKVFVSGSRPPHLLKKNERIAHLDKEVFMQKVFEMGGMPEEIMKNKELFELSYEILYADFSMLEEYNASENMVINVPLVACYGKQDKETNEEDMKEWKEYTTDEFELMNFDGGHFYIFEDKKTRDQVFSERTIICN